MQGSFQWPPADDGRECEFPEVAENSTWRARHLDVKDSLPALRRTGGPCQLQPPVPIAVVQLGVPAIA